MTTSLEDQFHQAMITIYEQEKRDCNYNATYFIRMVSEHGGLQAAKLLLDSNEPQDGFTKLWECGRLDLSVEALVLNAKFSPLFSQEEKDIARDRLKNVGYFDI
jgi:hypothetical protein